MSAAASLITNCSAYKHDLARPPTIIPADGSALPSIRTKAAAECEAERRIQALPARERSPSHLEEEIGRSS